MAETIIETERLLLRTQAPSDFEDWMAEINTAAVREYLGGLEAPEKIEQAFAKVATSQRTEGFSFWFLEDKASGHLLGSCGLKRADADGLPEPLRGAVETGWLLREDAWGKGLATEAARASISFAFKHAKANCVIALTSRSNIGSWKVMEKLGMRYRPEWDFEDPAFPPRDNPTIVYEIRRDEWEKQECTVLA